MAPFQPDHRLQRIIADVVARAIALMAPQRIWLFGSQAAGTARRDSDADFGFEISPSARENWSRFVLEAAESVPALIELDLVDLGTCSPSLADVIRDGARLIYEAQRDDHA